MDKNWKIDQLEKLRIGKSIYKYIPENIGNILYCDTTEPKEYPLTPQQASKRKILGMLFCIISLSLCWGFLYEHYFWGIIITIIICIITLAVYNTSFSGVDYFIGDKGFSIVEFSNKRDNIINKQVWQFDDLAYLFTGECVKKVNFSYSCTDYYFSFYRKLDSDGKTYDVGYSTAGSYSDKSPKDPMNPEGASPEYCFMKELEKVWTLYFFNEHKNDSITQFPLIKDNHIYSDAISVSRDFIDIYGVKYTKGNTKKIYISNGLLIVEHENHSKRLLGLIEKGNISSIPLSDLGNRQAFLLLFNSFYKS